MRGKTAKLIRKQAELLEPGDRNFYRYLKKAWQLIPRNLKGVDRSR